MGTKRTSLTLPEEVLSDVDYICSSMSVSRSVFVSEILRESIKPIVEILEIALCEEEDGVRYRDPQRVRSVIAQYVAKTNQEYHKFNLAMEEDGNGKH